MSFKIVCGESGRRCCLNTRTRWTVAGAVVNCIQRNPDLEPTKNSVLDLMGRCVKPTADRYFEDFGTVDVERRAHTMMIL